MSKTMSKRKRDDTEGHIIDSIQDRAIRIKASRLKVRVDHGVRVLTNAVKLAKSFDRQKMTRRIKEAGKDQAKVERLTQEVEILKRLDATRTANDWLMKWMTKNKKIHESPSFQALYHEFKARPLSGVAEGNVIGRLFKSDAVNEVLPEVMKSIREVLGLGVAGTNNAAKSDTVPVTSIDHAQNSMRGEASEKFSGSDGEFNGFSDNSIGEQQDLSDNDEAEGLPDGDELYEIYGDRLAASSDSSDPGSEADSEDNDEDEDHDRYSMEITTDEDHDNEDTHMSDDDLGFDDAPREIKTLVATQTSRGSNAALAHMSQQTSSSTSFLPTLSMGGYYSGSEHESEIDNGYDPDKAFAAAQPKPRKNRRGQQERRKIAEKKFGAQAKHIQNGAAPLGQRPVKSAGWDPRRGAVDGSRGGRGGRMSGGRGGRPKWEPTGANAGDVGPRRHTKKDTVSQPVHPSWEAAKKRKAQGSGATAFEGKKVTFD